MKIKKLSPNFEVADIRQTVNFYTENLGFTLAMAVPETQDGIEQFLAEDKEYVYVLLVKDEIELMLQRSDSFKQDVQLARGLPIAASVSFYMEVEGLDDLYAALQGKGLNTTSPRTAWYGLKEFYIKDNNGYILGFAEKAEQQ